MISATIGAALAPQPELIVLIGFMGAGKSSVGRALARRLKWRFVDLDRWIEQREHRRIAQIFAQDGEAAFRKMESEALQQALANREVGTVLALGGGAWIQGTNAQGVRAAGAHVIYLDASHDELRDRCAHKPGRRPLFEDEDRFRQLHEARRSSYMQADWRIDTTGRSPAQVAAELAQRLLSGVSNESHA
jgi:shikimate kinase